MLDPNVQPVRWKVVAGAIGPLDDRDAPGLEAFLPPGGSEIGVAQAVEVEVEQRQAPFGVLVEDHEGRAGHGVFIDAEADPDPPGEDRLPRAELAPERDHLARDGVGGKTLPEALGVQGRMAQEVDGRGVMVRRRSRVRICVVQERGEW